METKELKIIAVGDVLTARIYCELDNHTSRRVRERIDENIFLSRPEVLILDFSEVRFMDSSGLALILGRVQRMETVGGRVELHGLSPQLLKLVRLAGIERIKALSVK